MAFYFPSAAATAEDIVSRSSANYHPTLWGDRFLSFSSDSLVISSFFFFWLLQSADAANDPFILHNNSTKGQMKFDPR